MRSHVRSATVSDLAAPFDITLTGLKKHLGVLEEVERITTEKIGRSRHCRLGPRTLDDAGHWIADYRRILEARFDRLGQCLEHERDRTMSTLIERAPGSSAATPSEREVVVERVFNAPRHVVWQAFGFGMQKGRDQSYAALDRLLAEVAGTAAGQIGSTQHGGEDV